MMLTHKIKHGLILTSELAKAKKIAEFAIKTRSLSSASVKHFGLKSVMSNQILRKYSRNKNIKKISNVKLTIPSQAIKTNNNTLYISCLKLKLILSKSFEKVCQIELDEKYAFVTVSVKEASPLQPIQWLGVDMNATGHCAVIANATTGKVLKLGKNAHHIHNKYKNIRKRLQKNSHYRHLKMTGNKESRIVKDINHKISKKIINEAIKQNAGIVIEDLKGIRKTKKQEKSFKYSLNSWSFYQLRQFLEYKAKLYGIPVFKVDPFYTSQQCSRCGLLGDRRGKSFKCPHCGHVEHADVNAAFVIAGRHIGAVQMPETKTLRHKETDTLKEAPVRKLPTLEPATL